MSFFRHGMPDGPGFPKVPVTPSIESFLSHSVGAAPLVAALCRELGIPQLIDQEATWDKDRSILSPGERIMALIINLLCEERRPLYKVHDAFEKLDTELLFGEGIRSDHLNNDCLGRGLDAFYRIGPSRILRQVALSLRLKEAMDLPFVHFDTTTRVLYGAYGFEGAEEDPLDRLFSPPPVLPPSPLGRRPVQPAYGHSKDHRPDLKQITLALAVDRHGLPLLGSIKDGNASDKVSNLETLDEILAFFPPELRDSLVYIADSALVTETNLAWLSREKMRFISLLPGTFAANREVRDKAWDENAWDELGALRDQKDAATYRASEQATVIGGRPYRLIVYHSSTLDKRKSRSLLSSVTQEKAALEKAARELAKTPFFCERDAQAAGEAFCRSHKSRFFPLSFTVETKTVKEPRPGRGRPKKGESLPETPVFLVNVTVGGVDPAAVAQERDRKACFVLITNLPKETASARTILDEYKGQASVENIFGAFVKNPLVLDAFFLKKKERLEALGMVLLLAALVYMFIQYKMRQAKEPFDRPPRGMMTRPTTREVLQHLSHVTVHRINNGPRHLQISQRSQNGFDQILRWTGIDPRVYLVPPVREKRRKVSKTPGGADQASGKTPSAHPPPPPCESPPQTQGGHRDSLN